MTATIQIVASLDTFSDPSGSGHRYLTTRIGSQIMVSRIGRSGKPLLIGTLSRDSWTDSIRIALDDSPEAAPVGWPGASIFSAFCRAVIHEASQIEIPMELDWDDIEIIDEHATRARRRFTVLERHQLERDIRAHLATGSPFSAWWVANRDRIGRTTAYRWAQRIRQEGREILPVGSRASDEQPAPGPGWIPRIIAGGRA